VRCLVTAVAHDTFGRQLERDGIDWVIMDAEGGVRN
jgi:hypothetical protein